MCPPRNIGFWLSGRRSIRSPGTSRQTPRLQLSVPVRSKRDSNRVRLQPADAFDLIRWLARSQCDPRKAVAELVQNAIDANARTIVIERRRRGKRATLLVRDDGDGIRPDEDRETAL